MREGILGYSTCGDKIGKQRYIVNGIEIMDKMEAIISFVEVARCGCFSRASRSIGVPLPTVSRRVAELEEALGARLFHRSTRQVVLTEAGNEYFQTCQRLLDELKEADEKVGGEYRSPRGELCVTAPFGFGRVHLQPVALEFLKAYPDIDLKLMLVDRVVDLVAEHVDVALRISELADSSMVAKNVGQIGMVVYGAPGYLEQYGVPEHPDDLINHSAISWAALGPFKTWLFRESGVDTMFPIRVRVTTTMPDSALEAAVEGLGLVQLTTYQAADAVRAGKLVPVLRDFECPSTPVNLVYPSNRSVPLKLRAFLDFAAPRLAVRLKLIAELSAQKAKTSPRRKKKA